MKKGKSGSKRKISQVKRSNIKRHKLVKQGKAKPNSQPRYIANQSRKAKNAENGKQNQMTPEQEKALAAENEQDRDAAMQELADELPEEEKEFLQRMARKRSKNTGDDEDIEQLEKNAIDRIESESHSTKKLKAMLPIKTKDGLKERHVEVLEEEDEEKEPAEGDDNEKTGTSDDNQNNKDDVTVAPGQQFSVVELYVQRKALLREKKIMIGSLAASFLEQPEERIINLERLVKMVAEPQAESVETSVHRLAAASVLAVLKDVTPGYRIVQQDGAEKLKKETLRLQKFEGGLLRCYKLFLVKLERQVNLFKRKIGKSTPALQVRQSEFFLSCMCQLLVAHPHFNYAKNILHAVVPILTAVHEPARLLVREAVQDLFRADLRGEVSLEAVTLINQLVKSRKHNVRCDVVDVLKSLRIKNVNLDKEKEEEIETKKKEARKQKLLEKNHISRQEKKRKKRLESLEKELLEARGEEGKKIKEKYFTGATKLVFLIYFRILKSYPRSKLMGSVLEGLSKFAHVINLEFFSDLIAVFQSLLSSDFLTHRDSLLIVSTVFTILSGQGEALNIDPASFYTHLYNSMFLLEPIRTHDDVPLAVRALADMLIKRRKRVSRARILGFCKRVGTLSLQLLHHGALSCLGVLREIINTHTVALELLDSEHEVGSGVFDASIRDPEHCSASNTTSWELSLMHQHYHPLTARLSTHVASQCPSSGELSITQDLKKPADELFEIFSMDKMAFNPSIKPPGGKRGKHATPITISTTLDSIVCNDSLDFFSAAKANC